jgi:prepilin peptidase CpaA
MLEAATLLLFPGLMVFAALSDLLTMTISNYVSAVLVILFPAMAFACGLSMAEIFWHFSCGAAVLVLTFFMFARGLIGGGDAKLAAATAVWLGFDHLGDYALLASLSGGLLAIFILGIRKWPLSRVFPARQAIAHWLEPGSGIPYGVALAGAGLLLYPETSIWTAAAFLR